MLLNRGETDPDCLAQTQFRRNADGTIRDVTSNRKFFNMDLDLVNDRLWNGYYLTPAQFIFDIECMVKDSKAWPDRDRTNRAEEMLVNTQTYISEVFDETLILECDRMAEREFERQKILQAEKEAKAKRKAEREKEKERLRLAALQQDQEASPTKMIEHAPASGDIPMLDSQGNKSSTSGSGSVMNGIVDGTTDMVQQGILEGSTFGSQQIAFQNPAYPPSASVTPTPTQPFQPMPPSNVNNLAPPTYNNHETLSPRQLQPSTFPGMPQNQGQYHGYPGPYHPSHHGPMMYPQPTYANPSASVRADSYHHINSSGHYTSPPPINAPYQQTYQPPQTPGIYAAPQPPSQNLTAHFAPSITHTSPNRPVLPRPSPTPHPSCIRDPARVERLLQEVTRQTAGYTLEQLEQVYAACMDIIWRLRHEWDRTVVIAETENCVRRILGEIEMMKMERQQDEVNWR